MRTLHNWKLGEESWDEQAASGRYHPCQQVHVKDGPVLTISAGTADDLDVFTEHGLFYVVSVNRGLETVGLEVFGDDGSLLEGGSVFLQLDYEVREILGPRGVDLSPMAIAKRLSCYAEI